MGPLDWQEHGLCREVGADLFFDDDDGSEDRAPKGSGVQSRYAQAKKVCSACPVWQECRLAGMGEDHGVWGGLSPRQRYLVRVRQSHEIGRRYWGSSLAEGDGAIAIMRRTIHRLWLTLGTVEATLEAMPLLDDPIFYSFDAREVGRRGDAA